MVDPGRRDVRQNDVSADLMIFDQTGKDGFDLPKPPAMAAAADHGFSPPYGDIFKKRQSAAGGEHCAEFAENALDKFGGKVIHGQSRNDDAAAPGLIQLFEGNLEESDPLRGRFQDGVMLQVVMQTLHEKNLVFLLVMIFPPFHLIPAL